MSTTIESLELEIHSSSTSAVQSIDALSNSLRNLKKTIQGNLNLNSVANQITNLSNATKDVDDSSSSKVGKLADSLSRLSAISNVKISSSIANQIKKIGESSSSITPMGLVTLTSLAKSLTEFNNVNEAIGLKTVLNQLHRLPKIADKIHQMDLEKFTRDLLMMSRALRPLATQLEKVSNAFMNLPSKMKQVVSATNKITKANNRASSSYINLWAKASIATRALRLAYNLISEWVNESNKYIENVNLFNVAMGKYGKEARAYAEQVGEVMGIDPGDWMRNQGVIMSISEGFGVASDRAYIMSKNLTQLGYDLSSLFNISYEESMQKLTSGISGELEPLRRLGYDLSQAQLKSIALRLGIRKTFNEMTQAEKAQLRYMAIMEQVTISHGDMARTLIAPSNQLRILQAQVRQTSRSLGNMFIPALQAVLPYAIAFVKVIKYVADALAKLVGYKPVEFDTSGITKSANAMGDFSDNVDKASGGMGKAANAAKKLKNALLGIDELNIISQDEDKGLGGLGGGIGPIGDQFQFLLPQYDFMNGIDNKANEIFESIKASLSSFMLDLGAFSLVIGTILVVSGASVPVGLALMVAGATELGGAIALNWNTMSDEMAKKLADIESMLAGFFITIGTLLAMTGNLPLGIGLIAFGVAQMGVAAVINWKFLEGSMGNALAILLNVVGTSFLVLGTILAVSGANIPLGIGLMILGAMDLVAARSLSWGSLSEPTKRALGAIQSAVGLMLLGLGAVMAFSGAGIPLGIALMAAGAVNLVSAVVINWSSLTGTMEQRISALSLIISPALLVLGGLLAFTGAALPLGIALLAAGAVGLVAGVILNWGSLATKIDTVLKEMGGKVSGALLALGAILSLTGVAIPIGIALLAAGAAAIGRTTVLNWSTIKTKVKSVLKDIGMVSGVTMLGVGLILCLSGVGIPVGLALMAAGAASFTSGVSLNWDEIGDSISSGLKSVSEKWDDFTGWIGEKLDKAGEKISSWASGVKKFFTGEDEELSSSIVAEGESWADKLKDGISRKFNDMKPFVETYIFNPIERVIKERPAPEVSVGLKNNTDTWWSNARKWWDEKKQEGLDVGAMVSLVKKEWTTVSNWIGEIPVLSQKIDLIKDKWASVKEWIGDIPTLEQKINLSKEKLWTTVKDWVGEIPVLMQRIGLEKFDWTTIKQWIGDIPVLNQAIDLIRTQNWSTVGSWIRSLGDTNVFATVNLQRGYTSLQDFVGDRVNVSVNLIGNARNILENFFSGATNDDPPPKKGGRGHRLATGGYFDTNGNLKHWGPIPAYAGGTLNAGSMFVAGEAGAELVGHINGQTEVLNKSQIQYAMRNAVVAGMAQFTGYWKAIVAQLAYSTGLIVKAVDLKSQAISSTGKVVYTSENNYLMAKVSDGGSVEKDGNDSRNMDDLKMFYKEYVEPTLKEIALDTKRQADKEEKTVVQIGSRVITDVIDTQRSADGFVFTE